MKRMSKCSRYRHLASFQVPPPSQEGSAVRNSARRPVRAVSAAVLLALAGVSLSLGSPALAEPVPTQPDIRTEHLTTDTVDPTAIDVAPDGRVFWAERQGAVKTWKDGVQTLAAQLPVAADNCAECPDEVEEGGIHGLALSPDFAKTRHIYLYHSVPGSVGVAPKPAKHPKAGGTAKIEGLFRISRFTAKPDGTIDLKTAKPVFDNPAEWRECCHYAGDMDWMPDGTLLLSVGDDTNPFESNGFAPRDKRPGREAFDADRTSQNPADRRGKVLRIDVRDVDRNGSLVPKNNPHVRNKAYDPYVYAMGFRNPYRIAVDEKSGAVLVGNVGPDAGFADASRGPEGIDEIEFVPPGGGTNHGWPRCIGQNRPYIDYDFKTGKSGKPLNCKGFEPARIYYPYGPSTTFPTLLTGTKTPMPGLVYNYQGKGERALPDDYQGNLLFLEWSRNAAYRIPTEKGEPDPEQVVPLGVNLNAPMDAAVGPDGAVYIVEYGLGYYNTPNAAITRMSCLACADGAPTGKGTSLAESARDLLNDAAASIPTNATGGPPAALLAAIALLVLGVPLHRRTV